VLCMTHAGRAESVYVTPDTRDMVSVSLSTTSMGHEQQDAHLCPEGQHAVPGLQTPGIDCIMHYIICIAAYLCNYNISKKLVRVQTKAEERNLGCTLRDIQSAKHTERWRQAV